MFYEKSNIIYLTYKIFFLDTFLKIYNLDQNSLFHKHKTIYTCFYELKSLLKATFRLNRE